MTTQTSEVIVPAGTVFAVDVEARTIRGRAVPFGVEAKKLGQRFQFSKGTVRPYGDGLRSIKLWALHDKAQAVGYISDLDETEDGGYDVTAKVARGPEGDKALTMAEDGVWDGMSIGLSEGAKFALRDGVYHAVDVPIHEVSLTPAPVFAGARVQSVTFDITPEENPVTQTAPEPTVEAPPGLDFSALSDAMRDGITAGFAGLATPQAGGPERISPTAGLQVEEPSPYRFDGVAAEHSFVGDLRAAYSEHDHAARGRVDEFLEELQRFAVTTGNVASFNPTQNRPDLYVPNLTFATPLWDLVSNGVVENQTPFTVPKFSSASGLVGAHTQGVEPTPGAFQATSQTITPAPKSGKIQIVREVWDQGGSPQADQIIWAEMLNGWYEAREVAIATQLAATATAEMNLASAVDTPLVDALTAYFAGLQFVRGGNRFTAFAADGKLFPALVAAKDGQGRKLLPILGPQNAQGTVAAGFDQVQLGNQAIRAAWALGSSNASQSYSFVPSSVWAWASTPKKFTFEYQVSSIDMAIWGYVATATLRDSDVKPVDYTTADS